ncbi:MAG: hypothetical protein H0T46_19845 [Deltaproteobacteria bacterium]|nr:hypothetical protein [Deltaproteobacteria bacterium]
MLKTLLSSAALITLLCGPALANTPAKPATPLTPLKFKVVVTDGSELRTFEITLLADTCGSLEDRAGDRFDEIKLCPRDSASGVRLGAMWKLRSKTVEHSVSFESVIAKGKNVEVGREKGARLTVTMI